ncbi:MAG: ABC transporter ATP-binding protein [Lachnospiraceae bacterium]|nr:ABC transporter ATP-binding protein [Lachnospiraceae bacterium]
MLTKKMKKQPASGAGSMQTLKKVLGMLGRYRLYLLMSIVLATASVILQLYVPILFGDAIDGIIGSGRVNFALVSTYALRILILVLSSAAATWIMNMINNRMTYRVVQDVRSRALHHIQTLPLSYLDAHSAGDIVSRVIADADQLSDGLLLGFTQLFTGVITIVMTLIFMLSKNIPITLMVVLLTPLSFFVARFISTHTFNYFSEQSKARGEQTGLIEEMIGNAKVVKAFGYEKKASARFADVNARLEQAGRKAVFYSSLTNPCTRFVNNVIYAAVALVGAFVILAGHLSVGGLSVLLSYASQYTKPFNDISSVVTELQNALACAQRLFALIEEKPEPAAVECDGDMEESREKACTDKGNAGGTTEAEGGHSLALSRKDGKETARDPLPEREAAGCVELDHVCFSYVKDRKLIEDYSLCIRPGMHAAIVGPTGCGKTTLINLLMRFYDVDSGDIRIDGRSIYEMSRHELRSQYGMVLQDTWIRSGTVRDNITLGRTDVTDEEIIAAAKEAHSWSFIRRLPKRLDTVLTEDSLSQGQKQLLCITRVMLSKPPMLILDEATSSIDTRTELRIQKAFDRLMEGRTSFVVAHRLSTIRSADVILVMKDGRIIEQGSHEELMEQNGFYTRLYNSQFAQG